jgi:hypothetical protein
LKCHRPEIYRPPSKYEIGFSVAGAVRDLIAAGEMYDAREQAAEARKAELPFDPWSEPGTLGTRKTP